MQTRLFRFLFLLLFASTIFTSCKKTNKLGKQIPANASFVLMINGEALNSKLSWDDIKQNQLFRDMSSDTSVSQYVKDAMENPDNTGIDVKNDILFYIQQDSVGGYAVLQGKIKDATKFQAFYTNVTKASAVAGKNGANSLSNDKLIATWDKDRFAIVFDVPEMSYANMKQMPFPNMSDSVDVAPQPPIVKKRDMTFAGNAAFYVEEKNSLAKDEKFTELLNEKGDVHFWMNSERLTGDVGMGALDMLSIGKLYKGVYITGTATFLDGKIEVNTKSYAGKELTDLFKKYESKNIDESFLKRLPSKNVAVVAAMNYPPEGLLALVKLAGLEGFANMGASSLGFTLDDFVKANKGDLLFSVSGLRADSNKVSSDIFFSTSIKDKAAFNKLVEAGKKMMATPGTTDSLSKAIFQNSNGNYFAIGTNQADIDAFFKNDNNNNSASLPDNFTGNPLAVYVNFQNVFSSMTPRITDTAKVELHNASVQMWDNMLIRGGQFKDGGVIQKVEVNLVDKKVNSLKQLNNYFGVLGAINEKNKRMNPWKDSNRVMTDTTFAGTN